MAFIPSPASYGAVDVSQLTSAIGGLVNVGAGLATTAINAKSATQVARYNSQAAAKSQKQAYDLIDYATPGHSPVWPIALAVGGGVVVLALVFGRKKS